MTNNASDSKSERNSTLSSVSFGLLNPNVILANVLVMVVALAVGSILVWAAYAKVVEVAVGVGRVIPASKLQLIQNLEGGVIKEILVHEGNLVKKGQLLVKIDPVSAGASLEERRQHILSFQAATQRFSALANSKSLKFLESFSRDNPELVSQNFEEYKATLASHHSAVSILNDQVEQKKIEIKESEAQLSTFRKSLEVSKEQFELYSGLFKDGAASKLDLLSSKSAVLELEGRISQFQLMIQRLKKSELEISNRLEEVVNIFKAENISKLNEVFVKLNALKEATTVDLDKVERSYVKSPVDGIVKTLLANTIGHVIKPAENILEIVPLNDNLLIQAQILPKDIAFIRHNQGAIIKLSSFDYSIYGALNGTVQRIGADSVTDEQGKVFFPVDIKADQAYLLHNGKKLPILPGMMAQVDIVTGNKTILSYVTKPIHRMSSNAFRER